jgi:hypothetical protein
MEHFINAQYPPMEVFLLISCYDLLGMTSGLQRKRQMANCNSGGKCGKHSVQSKQCGRRTARQHRTETLGTRDAGIETKLTRAAKVPTNIANVRRPGHVATKVEKLATDDNIFGLANCFPSIYSAQHVLQPCKA